jgi:hypothetical protein
MLTADDAFLILVLALHCHHRNDLKIRKCANRILFICDTPAQAIVTMVIQAKSPARVLRVALGELD